MKTDEAMSISGMWRGLHRPTQALPPTTISTSPFLQRGLWIVQRRDAEDTKGNEKEIDHGLRGWARIKKAEIGVANPRQSAQSAVPCLRLSGYRRDAAGITMVNWPQEAQDAQECVRKGDVGMVEIWG